ncbi:type II toxin-antitoxin system VapB family antitoxin (plasmid) [Xanthobacter dioxanivorans]|uniref:Type II toxin-antitoxin system VapB family antitoxin n=1 Tax=Xanthobacter dioxanivorans TaxID=2528964 RepID=A0A974PUM5_9HYPH|nr:type II toxin-antitoxin system VapB family antitoxin [Xanthobacter dioxanivorans]QRG10067.1 type II toxin-antitoxin system VapB family antitoxin [Xanthobacter dioxanivorans]
MAFHVRNDATERAVRALSRKLGVGLTEAVKIAVENELKRQVNEMSLRDRIKPLQEQIGLGKANGGHA